MATVLLRRIGCRPIISRLHGSTAVASASTIRLSRLPHSRLYSTPFIPVQQLLQTDQQQAPTAEEEEEANEEDEDEEDDEEFERERLFDQFRADPAQQKNLLDAQPRPNSPAFYTGRHQYYDTLVSVRTAIGQARATLKTLCLLPLPAFARASLLPLPPNWKDIETLSRDIGLQLNTTRYRRLVALLNELNELLRIATTAGATDLAEMLERIVGMFEKGSSLGLNHNDGRGKKVELDEFGRSYTLGRRKTSSARVWMIPVQKGQPVAPLAAQEEESDGSEPTENATEPALALPDITTEPASESPDIATEPSLNANTLPSPEVSGGWEDIDFTKILDTPPAPATAPTPEVQPEATVQPIKAPKKVKIPISTILVNNIPISQYFPNPLDREKITYPLKVAGVLGKYNIFAIARGGGSTGQTGAIAHGITRGLLAHEDHLLRVLRKASLVKRDPRMVERKKTGRAKARKGYTWVKR